jgi:hypothetical protein
MTESLTSCPVSRAALPWPPIVASRAAELGRRIFVMSTGIYNLRQSIGFRGRPVRLAFGRTSSRRALAGALARSIRSTP